MLPWNPAIKAANTKKTSRVPTHSEKNTSHTCRSLHYNFERMHHRYPTQPRVEIKTSDQCCSSIQGIKTSKITVSAAHCFGCKILQQLQERFEKQERLQVRLATASSQTLETWQFCDCALFLGLAM